MHSCRLTLLGTAFCVALLSLSSVAEAKLPRTYKPIRIDNPTPASSERFGDGLVNGGDVNGDGKDDLLVGIDEHGTISGEVFVFSGANGAPIRRIPAPDPDAGGSGDNPDAFGTYVGKIADVGGCQDSPAPAPGADCASASATGDGVPDHLASAIGVDVDAAGDDMGVDYVLDGKTGAVLKRIRMPAADRTLQAANAPTASQGAAFGRTIISPSGQPPCQGFGGLGSKKPDTGTGSAIPTPCAYAADSAITRGDLDGGGVPDIVIGASDFTERNGSSPACTDPDPTVATETCFQAGRFYVYRGEDLDLPGGAGLAAAEESPLHTIKNPFGQIDRSDQNSRFAREAFGYSVAPVGDLGKCKDATPGPGALCLNAANLAVSEAGYGDPRLPDFIASSHRTDTNGMGDVGVAMAIDGPTGRVLDVYNHPEPQVTSVFAFSNYNQPAMGDLGSNPTPDVYQGAMAQNVRHRAQGRGWVLTGDFRAGGANHYQFAVLDDPTPNQIGNFGTSSAGVGDVAGSTRNELAIGAYGPHAPQVIDGLISDVHIFSPLGEQVLQTIRDPDNQPGSGFGRALAPMGDLNGDGMLDLAVGAGGYDPGVPVNCSPCTGPSPAQGRIYLLMSDDSPAPAGPGPAPGPRPAPGGGPTPFTGPLVLSARTLTLAARRDRLRLVRRGRRLQAPRARLSGVIESFTDRAGCEPGQLVRLQRRRPGRARYATFARVRSNGRGEFTRRFRARRTYIYRARVVQTSRCLGAVSERERINVLRPRRRR